MGKGDWIRGAQIEESQGVMLKLFSLKESITFFLNRFKKLMADPSGEDEEENDENLS